MKLTNDELEEKLHLESLRQSTTRYMSQDEQDRLSYLRRKMFGNTCTNPHCTGYQGAKKETECPKCKSKLFEFNEMEY